MEREKFIFTVGYLNDVAVVNKAQMKRYASYSYEKLLECGLLRAAYAAAVYDGCVDKILPVISDILQREYSNNEIAQVFGVYIESNVIKKYLFI